MVFGFCYHFYGRHGNGLGKFRHSGRFSALCFGFICKTTTNATALSQFSIASAFNMGENLSCWAVLDLLFLLWVQLRCSTNHDSRAPQRLVDRDLRINFGLFSAWVVFDPGDKTVWNGKISQTSAAPADNDPQKGVDFRYFNTDFRDKSQQIEHVEVEASPLKVNQRWPEIMWLRLLQRSAQASTVPWADDDAGRPNMPQESSLTQLTEWAERLWS